MNWGQTMGNTGAGINFLISTIFDLFAFVVMLRFLMQLTRADYYNPVSQFVVKVTDPFLTADQVYSFDIHRRNLCGHWWKYCLRHYRCRTGSGVDRCRIRCIFLLYHRYGNTQLGSAGRKSGIRSPAQYYFTDSATDSKIHATGGWIRFVSTGSANWPAVHTYRDRCLT